MPGKTKLRKNADGQTVKRCAGPEHEGEHWLTLDHFAADRSQSSGHKSLCRDCFNRRAREGYADNPEPKKQQQRDAYNANPQAKRDSVNRLRDSRVAARDQADEDFLEAETAKARARIAKQDREAEKLRADAAARQGRLDSDFAALRPDDFSSDDDFDTSVANDPKSRKLSRQASAEKRQEFSRAMGQTAADLRRAAVAEMSGEGDLVEDMTPETGSYVGKVAEQERRFGNRRLARSVSLFLAGEELARRMFVQTARQYFSDRIVPVGYAKVPNTKPVKRSVCLMLSDLHLGADLSGTDNPSPFGAVEEARRLEYVLRQAIDYKPQYREHSELVLMFNGDLIEGLLLHDFRDGAPLAEQKAVLWRYAMAFIGECAAAFPRVRVFWQPGNHGRDKVRHPGRATSRKWDGHEWEMGCALQMATSGLKNVVWETDASGVLNRFPLSIVDLHGAKFGLTHADTEIKLGHPDTKMAENTRILSTINATKRYDVQFSGFGFGHYHTGRYQILDGIRVLWNSALIPPNGHARASGYGQGCGQWLWEAVPGYPVGDVRFIEVGRAQDEDERLGTIIKPFRFDLQ